MVIRNAIENGRVIDYEKTKRATLSVIARQARLGNITEEALNANLAQFRKEVKAMKKGVEPNTRGNKGSNNSLRDGLNSNNTISETAENSNPESRFSIDIVNDAHGSILSDDVLNH